MEDLMGCKEMVERSWRQSFGEPVCATVKMKMYVNLGGSILMKELTKCKHQQYTVLQTPQASRSPVPLATR
jgi:hypothetical protein